MDGLRHAEVNSKLFPPFLESKEFIEISHAEIEIHEGVVELGKEQRRIALFLESLLLTGDHDYSVLDWVLPSLIFNFYFCQSGTREISPPLHKKP